MGLRILPVLHKGRDFIEGLVPRDSSISAVVHLAAGAVGAVGVTLGGAMLLPEHDAAKPDDYDRDEWREQSRNGVMVLSAGPLFLTAGHQLATDAGRFLRPGVSPMYFLAAGALLGAGFVTQPIAAALKD